MRYDKGVLMQELKECGVRVQEQVMSSREFHEYQIALTQMEQNPLANQLLSELIKFQQNPADNVSELVLLEQEIDRCEVLQDFFAARQKLSEYVSQAVEQEHRENPENCSSGGCHNCSC